MLDLTEVGLHTTGTVYRNLVPAALIGQALKRDEGLITENGALLISTGKYTGRSPNDKFTVLDDITAESIWWGEHNRPFAAERFDNLHGLITNELKDSDLYVQDCYAGADPDNRLRVRVITQRAWHSIFARNMFLQPAEDALDDFTPDFTVLHAPGFKALPERDGTASEAAVILNLQKKMVLICGTEYAGEIKKSIFTVLNFVLPAKGVLGMHCSANVSEDSKAALFFGLSGTGKTTLSADPSRALVGDDEHGWSDKGVFNFEGGCYAKVIRLDEEAEPLIYGMTQKFGTLLENVVIDPQTHALDLDDATLTENTRASYDIAHLPNTVPSGQTGQPTDIVMLTCDAFGVLPPLAQLTPEQAMYHFMSGYTAKVAGTERGVKEPSAVFSACFGAPFMARHPTVYAKLLGEKIARQQVRCWLVNTGWTGGAYGQGTRMKIQWTRALLEAALSGALDHTEFTPHPIFKVSIPREVPGVPAEILDPRKTWSDKHEYDQQARHLVKLFEANFQQYLSHVSEAVKDAGPSMKTDPPSQRNWASVAA